MNAATVLQQHVLAELAWDGTVDASHIGVTTNRGVVTLSGRVDSYFQKASAERAARRVSGVTAVANELVVSPPFLRDDQEITVNILATLSLCVAIPAEHIHVSVAHGWVALDGRVKWAFQKNEAEFCAWQVPGVQGVRNRIEVNAGPRAEQVKERIEAALARNAQIDAQGVTVDAQEGMVALCGTVASWAERDEAERAARSLPGVEEVENLLEVRAVTHGGAR